MRIATNTPSDTYRGRMLVSMQASICAGCSIDEALEALVDRATALGVIIEASLNEVHCMAFPGGTAEELKAVYKRVSAMRDAS